MKGMLIQDDVKLVEDRLQQFERNTGCELLLVVANTADPYPAAPWRFGFISAFLISMAFTYFFEFQQALLWPVSFFLLLALMVWIGHWPWAKRLALASWEVERECTEKALELFHGLGTSKVAHKVTAMIAIFALEREIEVLVDEKLKEKISKPDLDELVQIMSKHFSEGHMGLGLVHSIQCLEEKILKDFGGKVSDVPPSELKDTIHFLNIE